MCTTRQRISGRRSHACQAHIENSHNALLIEQQVPRLDVAVHDALIMRKRQPFGGLRDDVDRL